MEKYQEQIYLCQAIQKLDKALQQHHIAPFELNVCGGFALLLQEIRKDTNSYTDIDYIGPDLPEDVKKIMNDIGIQMNLGKNWINNDMLLPGSSIEDLEYATGKLHFSPKMQLSVIKVNVLDKLDLLRMKVISIDTSLTGMEFGGEFSRLKDFKDLPLLMDDLHIELDSIEELTNGYVEDELTYDLIDYYCMTNSIDALIGKSYQELQNLVSDYNYQFLTNLLKGDVKDEN